MKPIFIIAGEKGSGKTTFITNISDLLQKNGFVVAGFVATHDIKSDSYQITDIQTNEKSPLIERIATFDQRPNHFKFFSEGVKMGNDCIKELLVHLPDIAVVDEIGGYELREQLWSNSFTQLVESTIPLIFTVKERLLDQVLAKWEIEPTHIFSSADFGNSNEAFERIKGFLC